MIIPQAVRRDQHQARLALKSAEAAFETQIVKGTNCSPFEAGIITEKAKEVFGIGEHAEGRVLLDGQMVFFAVASDAAPGQAIEACKKVRIVLTHLDRDDDLEVQKKHGASHKRRQQMMRMAVEAQEQGALLTQEDLALILDCDVRTIRKDIQAARGMGITIPTRGTVRDIGPGISHKRRAIELWLSGKEALEVARHLNHSLRAVERYIQTFCRVVYAQREMRHILKTALVVGISVAASTTYWELHCDLVKADKAYQARLDEILSIGQVHWNVADGKKNPLLTLKPLVRGPR